MTSLTSPVAVTVYALVVLLAESVAVAEVKGVLWLRLLLPISTLALFVAATSHPSPEVGGPVSVLAGIGALLSGGYMTIRWWKDDMGPALRRRRAERKGSSRMPDLRN